MTTSIPSLEELENAYLEALRLMDRRELLDEESYLRAARAEPPSREVEPCLSPAARMMLLMGELASRGRPRQRTKEPHMSTATVVTNRLVLDRHEIPTDGIEHLDEAVPVIAGKPQRQGDVFILPCAPRAGGKAIPQAGLTVVRGEQTGGNAHILHNLEGECQWEAAPNGATELLQGWLTVPPGCSATLIHTQEHSVLAVGTGSYEVRGQRELAGEWRRVAD